MVEPGGIPSGVVGVVVPTSKGADVDTAIAGDLVEPPGIPSFADGTGVDSTAKGADVGAVA